MTAVTVITTTMITVVIFLDHLPFRKQRVFCNLQCNTEQEEKAEMLQCNNPPPPWRIIYKYILVCAYYPICGFTSYLLFQHKELEKYLIQPQGDYNPDLPIDEQTGCLPYDPKWEFPKDRLRMGEWQQCSVCDHFGGLIIPFRMLLNPLHPNGVICTRKGNPPSLSGCRKLCFVLVGTAHTLRS